MTYTVSAVGLSKSFGDLQVLDRVDLQIETGSVLALLGANGAGKTTLVRILATLVRPDAGTATIAGHDLLADPNGVKRAVRLTGQYAAVDEMLTGQENLEMMAELLRLPRRSIEARTHELLAEFDLLDARHRRAGSYSGGMKRRLDLAITMISRPELMFLDEPTTGLDPRSREQLWGTVRRLVDEGVTVLLTTQYLEEADQLADAIAVLDGGRVVAQGRADELKAQLGTEVVRLQFADTGSYERARAALFADRCLSAERSQDRLRTLDVPTDGSARELRELLDQLERAQAPEVKISTHRPGLDEVFFRLTSPSQRNAPDTSDHLPEELAG
jgi:ABC-2 type transport system ATP-binding protein